MFTGAIAACAGCAFGLAPVLQTLRLRLRSALESGGRGGGGTVAGPLRAALTIAQIACAVLLVVSAGLLVRSLWTLSRVDPGFDVARTAAVPVSPAPTVCENVERCLAFYRDVEAAVGTVPGVESAALVNTLPLSGAVAKRSLDIEGFTPARGGSAPLMWLTVVTPEYFRTLGIRLQAGRMFSDADASGSGLTAIVPASTARRFWPGESAIGRHVRFVGSDRWHTIVGVVSDVRAYDLTRNVPEWMAGMVYVPYSAASTLEDGTLPTEMTVVMRSPIDAARLRSIVQGAVTHVHSDVAVGDVQPLSTVVSNAVAAPAATASLLVTLAGLALVLGCVGVYGVLSFLVARRTRDLAIRLALGAQRADVFWLVIRESARLCAAGIALGVAGALAATQWLASELYGVSPTDPATYAAVVAIVSVVTFAASYVPTRRAMSVNPLTALRDQ